MGSRPNTGASTWIQLTMSPSSPKSQNLQEYDPLRFSSETMIISANDLDTWELRGSLRLAGMICVKTDPLPFASVSLLLPVLAPPTTQFSDLRENLLPRELLSRKGKSPALTCRYESLGSATCCSRPGEMREARPMDVKSSAPKTTKTAVLTAGRLSTGAWKSCGEHNKVRQHPKLVT